MKLIFSSHSFFSLKYRNKCCDCEKEKLCVHLRRVKTSESGKGVSQSYGIMARALVVAKVFQ